MGGTSANTSVSTAASDSEAGQDSSSPETTDDGAMDSTGTAPSSCDPACVGAEECYEGVVCTTDGVNVGGACGGVVSIPDDECDACVRASCCDALQGCFGDETVTGPTPCLDFYVCMETHCKSAQTYKEFVNCPQDNCGEHLRQQNAWSALAECMNDCPSCD